MNATRQLHDLGQSLWLDNITRDLLTSGTLGRYIRDLSVTGLTSNPTIFERAISGSAAYDAQIRDLVASGRSGEDLFFELAIDDLTRAADLFAPIHEQTAGVDGWVSLEVSPTLAHDAGATISAARALHAKAARPNIFIEIPGTAEGLPAVEEAIFAGVPVNATLLFSAEHCMGAADAYMRGLERRIAAGFSPDVRSVASVFISRWDKASAAQVPPKLRNELGNAVGAQAYATYRGLLDSDRWQRLANRGALPQRLLFASTGTKDPAASDVLYVDSLAAPHTVNTMPEETLLAFADHGEAGTALPPGGGDYARILEAYVKAGVDPAALAAKLQNDGVDAFAASWEDLLTSVAEKGGAER
ncbi:MAG TPA: transaldolase [Thermoleophilia bacterium]|nr:transaldolase [Thermoleophilia bacterium]